MISFIFDEEQATQAMLYLLSLSNDRIRFIYALKMLYLADREALSSYGYTITTDRYYAMKYGPVLSNIYDCIKSCDAPKQYDVGSFFRKYIAKNEEKELIPKVDTKSFNYDLLSEESKEIIKNIYNRFKDYSFADLIAYCHTLGEWEDPSTSSMPISIESIIGNAVEQKNKNLILEQLEIDSSIQRNNFRVLGRGK